MKFKRKPPPGSVRRPVPINKNIRGTIVNKAGRIVLFESWQERILFLMLERDPTVEDYMSQPEVFEFTDENGKRHTYTPDAIVWRTDGSIEIHEVTISERRALPGARRREQAAREICEARGQRYIVHTEKTLPGPTEAANLLALYCYRARTHANNEIAQVAFDMLSHKKPLFFVELVSEIAMQLDVPEGRVTSTLCHLIWQGHLLTDLNKLMFIDAEITPDTQVWME